MEANLRVFPISQSKAAENAQTDGWEKTLQTSGMERSQEGYLKHLREAAHGDACLESQFSGGKVQRISS